MKEYKYKINGNIYKVAVGDIDDNIAQVEVNGVPYKVELERKAAPVKVVSAPKAAAAPRTSTGEKVIAKPSAGSKGNAVVAPLPGVVLSIPVKVGDTVNAADTVLLLEAMKMENAIHAGRDGRIASINVNPGDSVLEGATLLTIE
ncbi:MAG: acetyl-CoA carboxylase biotin carboxyl carrier protein subunit [Muribaculaceae bacterium]|nr:acetyl-CoA carboxylase biotin carboxyl carrier protein subunit [Muribaculaceae bacterium]